MFRLFFNKFIQIYVLLGDTSKLSDTAVDTESIKVFGKFLKTIIDTVFRQNVLIVWKMHVGRLPRRNVSGLPSEISHHSTNATNTLQPTRVPTIGDSGRCF